jgi:hypothetical protein
VTERTSSRADARFRTPLEYHGGMIKLPVLMLASAALLLARPADAHVFEIFGQVRAGGGGGKGLSGDQKDADFFNKASGASYGFLVGAEVFWIDAWIEHDQFTNFSEIDGTWTQFMLGADVMIPLGEPPSPKEKPKLYGNIGFGAGFGIGTGQQIMPPLDNAQISDKGFMAELKLGLEYQTSESVAIGLTMPVTYGYMFKNGVPANDLSNQYQSLHVLGLLYVQLKLGIK